MERDCQLKQIKSQNKQKGDTKKWDLSERKLNIGNTWKAINRVCSEWNWNHFSVWFRHHKRVEKPINPSQSKSQIARYFVWSLRRTYVDEFEPSVFISLCPPFLFMLIQCDCWCRNFNPCRNWMMCDFGAIKLARHTIEHAKATFKIDNDYAAE